MKASSSLPYHSALDGMRGLGICTMLLYHTNIGAAGGAFLSLSMFFTLSGYLIAAQLIVRERQHGRIDLIAFWERRLRRLLPAALAGLLISIGYTAFLAEPEAARRNAGDILAALFYVPNWRFIATGLSYEAIFISPSPVQHFWSLGIEEQFYLLFPVLVGFVLVRGSHRTLMIVIGVLIAASSLSLVFLREPGSPLGHAYYGTEARAAEVLMGVLLALHLHRPRSSQATHNDASGHGFAGSQESDSARPANPGPALLQAAGLLGLAISLLLWFTTSETQMWFYRGGALAYSLMTCITLAAAMKPGVLQRVLATRGLAYVGRISYGLYVYHWPIYLSLDALLPEQSAEVLLLPKLATTLLLSVLSHRYLERRIRENKALVGPRRWLAPPISMAAVAVLSLGLIAMHRGVESMIPGDLADPILDASGADLEATTRIMVIGNSVAQGLARGMRQWAEGKPIGVWDRTQRGCSVVRGGERRMPSGIQADEAQHDCQRWSRKLPWEVEQIDPDIIVVLAGGGDLSNRRMPDWPDFLNPGDAVFDDWLVAEMIAVTDRLSAHGAHVAWLNWPCTDGAPRRSRWVGTHVFDLERANHLNQVLLPRVRAARPDTVSIIDLFSLVCPGGEFTHELAGLENARQDGVHLYRPEALWISGLIVPEMITAAAR